MNKNRRWYVPLLLFSICCLSAGMYWTGAPEKSPNIIFIIGDDISAEDIGVYGNQAIRTPNIDRLAKNGLKFDNLFLTASSCSPSRTSILTGRYPHNTGAAELHTPLPKHLTYFPEVLKKNGYYSALAGKWHEGENSRRAYDTLITDKKINGEGGENQWISLLKARPADKPFFFWLAPYDAHREWSANDEFEKPYKPDEVIVPPSLVDTKETRQDLAYYYNEISRIDHYIGELEKELERQGIADNTIIIFTADNARAFPGAKTRVLDRGLKTPFVIKWPNGIVKKGENISGLVSSIDIAPTLLELAGIKPEKTIQGVSFAKLLKEPAAAFRKYVFGEHNWHDYEGLERSVRTLDFLYLTNARPRLTNEGPIDANQSPSAKALKKAKADGTITAYQNEIFLSPRPTEEFFDNRKDPLQQHNLIQDAKYKTQIAALKKVLHTWQTETGDTAPENLTPDWYHRENGTEISGKGKRGEMPGKSANADRINHKGPF
ncbi:sulfatase [Dyadobacter sp. CY312]|uniref:sulfatase family protein n=1 Tax=Dyadobacter sp. CY312 TaxID=2907303 RepID=UPI001F3D332B|nr:sulfatase [Dyadobacter sp. CY312]MCE7044481.1 sulfatase [Dyadobacter sp. CY312]